MSAYIDALYTAIRLAIYTTWTDVQTNGIWEGENLEMVPWEDLTPPYAVFVWGEFPLSEEWCGIDTDIYEGLVHIFWVGATTGDSSAARLKIEALRDYLRDGSMSAGQVVRVQQLRWDNEMEPNKTFAEKNYTHRAGLLAPVCVVGEAH